MSQFSFDEKSSNFLSKKENAENNTKDNDKNKNEMLIKEDNIENKNNIDDNNNNEENNEIKYINKLTNEENEKNEDSNFDYELPLGSDDNPEFFYVCENTEESKKNIKNEKIEGGNDFPHHDIPAAMLHNYAVRFDRCGMPVYLIGSEAFLHGIKPDHVSDMHSLHALLDLFHRQIARPRRYRPFVFLTHVSAPSSL
jgi:hypothetical protein